jgi:O-antigen ligase
LANWARFGWCGVIEGTHKQGNLFTTALALAALSLLVAPFRSSAGLRAAALVIAAILLLARWWPTRTRSWSRLPPVPGGKVFGSGVAVWVAAVFLYSVFSPDPATSLASWRGDVLTPLLAGIVCYVLASSRREVGVMFAALFCGLLILAGMAVLDPFQSVIAAHEPLYLNVGWLSTWMVMLAALLPLAWRLQSGKSHHFHILTCVAAVAIAVGAWFSNNRIVWLCFGAMIVIYVAMNFHRMGGRPLTRIAFVVCGLIAAISMFFASSAMRAAQFPAANVDAVSILQRDDRQQIWMAATAAIAERPLSGYGFALDAGGEALAKQFSDPGFQRVFRQAHNVVLNYTLQMGIPGGLALLWLFAGLGHAFWRHRNAPSICGVAATCGLMLVAAFFLRNMTDDFFHRHAALLLGALIGMLVSVCEWSEQPEQAKPRLT